LHEAGELFELGPLVVCGPYWYGNVDKLNYATHAAFLLPPVSCVFAPLDALPGGTPTKPDASRPTSVAGPAHLGNDDGYGGRSAPRTNNTDGDHPCRRLIWSSLCDPCTT